MSQQEKFEIVQENCGVKFVTKIHTDESAKEDVLKTYAVFECEARVSTGLDIPERLQRLEHMCSMSSLRIIAMIKEKFCR